MAWLPFNAVIKKLLNAANEPNYFAASVVAEFREWKDSNDEVFFAKLDGVTVEDPFARHQRFLPKLDSGSFDFRPNQSGDYGKKNEHRGIPQNAIGSLSDLEVFNHFPSVVSEIGEEGYFKSSNSLEVVDVFIFRLDFEWFAYRDKTYFRLLHSKSPNALFVDIKDFIDSIPEKDAEKYTDEEAMALFMKWGTIKTTDFIIITTNKFDGNNSDKFDWAYKGITFDGWVSPAFFTYQIADGMYQSLPLIRNPDVKFAPINYAYTFTGNRQTRFPNIKIFEV